MRAAASTAAGPAGPFPEAGASVSVASRGSRIPSTPGSNRNRSTSAGLRNRIVTTFRTIPSSVAYSFFRVFVTGSSTTPKYAVRSRVRSCSAVRSSIGCSITTSTRNGLSRLAGSSMTARRSGVIRIRFDGIAGGVFCPTDGFMRPMKILEGYADGARRLGVRFVFGTPVVGLPRSSFTSRFQSRPARWFPLLNSSSGCFPAV